jgi:hypothetical protein
MPPARRAPPVITMTGAEFQAALEDLDIAVDEFSTRCGNYRQTVYRWIRHNTVPPWAAWIISAERRARRALKKKKKRTGRK